MGRFKSLICSRSWGPGSDLAKTVPTVDKPLAYDADMLHLPLLHLPGLALLLSLAPSTLIPVQDEDPVLGYHVHKIPGLTVITQWHSERNQEGLAQQVSALASDAWLRAQEALGLPLVVCDPPLTLELHNGRRAFVQAVRGLTGEVPGEEASHSDLSSGFALVTVAPVLSDRVHEVFGLPPSSLRLACEEMVRMGLSARLPQLAEQAPWLFEGLSLWSAQQTMVAGGFSGKGNQEPNLCRERANLRGVPPGELPRFPSLQSEISEAQGSLCHLAIEWLVLQEGGPAILAQVGGDASTREATLALLRGRFGDQGSSVLEAYLGELEYPWDERSPAMVSTSYGFFQVPRQGANAVCFQSQPVGFTSYRIEGDVMLFPGSRGTSQMNVFFGLDGESYLSVAITQNDGVTIFMYDPEKETFNQLARNLNVPVRLFDPTSFAIEVKDERLFVVVNGVSLESVELTGRPMGGALGFGAQRHGAGLWVRHEVKSLD